MKNPIKTRIGETLNKVKRNTNDQNKAAPARTAATTTATMAINLDAKSGTQHSAVHQTDSAQQTMRTDKNTHAETHMCCKPSCMYICTSVCMCMSVRMCVDM